MSESLHVLEAKDLSVSFKLRSRSLGTKVRVRAVDGVDLSVGARETVGIVGESGSGKSTTARALLRLVPIERGTVMLRGNDITNLSARRMRPLRRHAQMVFQDPYSSLDPSMTVGDSIAEPLQEHLGLPRRARNQRIEELLDAVQLSPGVAQRYPYEFSGGQRQRIAIARAIAPRPSVVVCDEAVSALDVSTQNQIINLLEDLQAELGLSIVFIAHDLAVVGHISDRIAVMYLGRVVEVGTADEIFASPAHPYTGALLSSIPQPSPSQADAAKARRIVLKGDVGDVASRSLGCAFAPRCPQAMAVCQQESPDLVQISGTHSAACHLHPTMSPIEIADTHRRSKEGAV